MSRDRRQLIHKAPQSGQEKVLIAGTIRVHGAHFVILNELLEPCGRPRLHSWVSCQVLRFSYCFRLAGKLVTRVRLPLLAAFPHGQLEQVSDQFVAQSVHIIPPFHSAG